MRKGNFTSKGQMQKYARSVLNSYQVDLTMLQLSCSTRSINLIGTLIGVDGEQLSFEEANSLMADLAQAGAVQSNLDNWDFNGVSPRKMGKNANRGEQDQDHQYDDDY